jgi:mono/diheme cytochrome c family protein
MDSYLAGRAFAVRAVLTAAIAVAPATAAGCGGTDARTTTKVVTVRKDAVLTPVGQGRFGYARGLFNELCAGCHTLADAGAHGHRFNLDVPNIEGAEVWNAVQNGEPGMPSWSGRLSSREISALAIYVMSVAQRRGSGEDRWGDQIRRRMQGERARWAHIAASIERELDREGRKAEQPSGRVVPPAKG